MRAVVDIGSNSIKYTLERTWGDASSQVSKSKVIALGKQLTPGGALGAEALLRLDHALADFAPDLRPCGRQIVVVGTAALRSCSNPQAAHDLVAKYLQVKLHILAGQTEAELSFLGASSSSSFSNPLCIDVGGASTEIGLTQGKLVTSVPWGALRVHENILGSQSPVNAATWQEAQHQLDLIFASELKSFHLVDASQIDGVLAIGGSLLMCAKALYPQQSAPRTVTASLLRLRDFNDEIAPMDTTARVKKLGFSADRAEIACAGLMCLFAALTVAPQLEHALITEGGLRQGILLRWNDFNA